MCCYPALYRIFPHSRQHPVGALRRGPRGAMGRFVKAYQSSSTLITTISRQHSVHHFPPFCVYALSRGPLPLFPRTGAFGALSFVDFMKKRMMQQNVWETINTCDEEFTLLSMEQAQTCCLGSAQNRVFPWQEQRLPWTHLAAAPMSSTVPAVVALGPRSGARERLCPQHIRSATRPVSTATDH